MAAEVGPILNAFNEQIGAWGRAITFRPQEGGSFTCIGVVLALPPDWPVNDYDVRDRLVTIREMDVPQASNEPPKPYDRFDIDGIPHAIKDVRPIIVTSVLFGWTIYCRGAA